MSYVDGFLIPVPKKKLAAYLKMAKKAGKIWCQYGALAYKECVGDDLAVRGLTPFPRAARAKKGEVVVFSYIVYRSKAHRTKVNKAVMADPRIAAMCNSKDLPFDPSRMAYGGFKVAVDL
jgi:uncharacterized protein YbaA (DUF1428 family)